MTTTAPPPGTTRVGPPRAAPDVPPRPVRPVVTELRLAAFASHWRRTLPLGPLTLLTGPSGSGASSALRAYEALARLGAGDALEDVFPDPVSCVPERAVADAEGRRGFRIGCTVDGPAGPVRLDVAVQAEPSLRIVGERLTAGGQTLLSTALRDPRRPTVQAAWHTAGQVPVTRAPLPDGRLATALLPLRVAGVTEGQLRVLAAAEQVVVGLHSAFLCDPLPGGMRGPARAGEERLRSGCDNLAAVLARTRTQCAHRHARLVAAAAAGCAGPVTALTTRESADGKVEALVGRGAGRTTPIGRLGDGELRYVALALVLLTGPHVLEVNTPDEIPWAMRALTVLTDGFDRGLDARQSGELLRLAAGICADGHLRLLGTVGEAGAALAGATEGAVLVDLSG
ncbi:ATP-binding protein [Streptomyces sp. NBC_01218]|uniref:ATP-binding protein n=1 Tax=unclassified Streptomyces TaxID=2593676 RepID=UPI002E11D163|nr:ATP-binding protein [Streptomyces sp. NBC_01218]